MADSTAPQTFDFGSSLVDLGKTALTGFFSSITPQASAPPAPVIVQNTPAPAAAPFNVYYIAAGAAGLVLLIVLLKK